MVKKPRTEGEEAAEQIALNNLKSRPWHLQKQGISFFERVKENVVKLLGEHGGTLPLDQFKPFNQIRFGEVFDIRKAGIPGSKKLGNFFREI